MAIHAKVVEIFQSGLKRWTDQLTDRDCHPYSNAAKMDKNSTHSGFKLTKSCKYTQHSVFVATLISDVASQQFVAQVQTLWALDILQGKIKQVTLSAQESLSEPPLQKQFS